MTSETKTLIAIGIVHYLLHFAILTFLTDLSPEECGIIPLLTTALMVFCCKVDLKG